MKHAGFTPIGQIVQTEALANQRMAGRNAGPTGADASQADIARIRAFLATRNPQEVDEAAVLRASELGVVLHMTWDHRFPRDERGNRLPDRSVIKRVQVVGDAAACRAAAKTIWLLQTEAGIRDIEAWLAELSVIVAKRQDDEFTEALRLETYAGLLSRYPADVVRAAVLGRTWPFWPSWYELEAVCEQLAAPRRAMLRSLDARWYPVPGSTEAKAILAARAMEIASEIWGDPTRMPADQDQPNYEIGQDLANCASS